VTQSERGVMVLLTLLFAVCVLFSVWLERRD